MTVMFVHCAVSLRKLDIYMDVNMKMSYVYITLFDLLYTTVTFREQWQSFSFSL